jgi:hypothetical protein
MQPTGLIPRALCDLCCRGLKKTSLVASLAVIIAAALLGRQLGCCTFYANGVVLSVLPLFLPLLAGFHDGRCFCRCESAAGLHA